MSTTRKYIIIVFTTDKRIGFYTGDSIDTNKIHAKLFGSERLANSYVKDINKAKGVIVSLAFPSNVSDFQYVIANLVYAGKKSITMAQKQRALNDLTGLKNNLVKNPVNNGYILKVKTFRGEIGFYNGFMFDVDKTKAKIYRYKKDINEIIKKERENFMHEVKFTVEKKKAIKKKTLNNPIAGSKKRRINKASNLYEDFTGHTADSYENVDVPEYDTGLKVGKCCGIMYETIRDGKKEKYLHEFKKTSQPDFCISHDGQQIFLIGGSYLFKDSGINDT